MTPRGASGDIGQNVPVDHASHRVQKGVSLGVSAVVVGLLTAFSGVVIELASGFLSDLRHGVCVERIPGDTRPLWHAGFRPYNRMRCCGGALSVDHATQECRAHSIISSTTPKRFAYPLRDVVSFGQEFGAPAAKQHMVPHKHHRQSPAFTSLLALDVKGQHGQHGQHGEHGEVEVDKEIQHEVDKEIQHEVDKEILHVSGSKERASHIDTLVGQDALSVRTHMSHLFDPDPTEKWAEEDAINAHAPPEEISPSSNLEAAVNEDDVQTQSESAGNLEPFYEWVPWDRALRAKGRTSALLISILGSALLALGAALLTRQAIQAKGSGIPEVRASVAGFALPKHFCGKTLLAKVSGLSLCVGSGLAVGKEGPMIHIGACWGSLLAGSLSRLGGFKTALPDTELICVGAAAGVSAAFGAPLAGILFCVEELGTSMAGGLRYSTMIGAFASAVIAALTMKWMDLTRTQRLTLFEVDYKQAWEAWESVVFVLVGVVGGLIGGAFILANSAIHRRRIRAPKDCFCWFLPACVDRLLQQVLRVPAGGDSRVLEIVLLAIFTCVSNFPRTLTRLPQNDAIFALFSQCHADPAANATGHTIHDPIGLCLTQNTPNLSILWLLMAAAAIRFLQTSITFGAMVPAGLFVPSLFMGGCIGRMVGILLKFAGFDVEPGIYAMVGAGAVLAGVSRLTISLVVVLFELTGGLTYIVPFMLSVLTAKWVGDAITDGQSVYDVHAEFSGLAKVEQLEDARLLNITMEDLCGTDVTDVAGAESGGTDELPVLWTSCGLVRVCDLAAHCGVAAKGFVVLSTDGSGDVEVLGWADSNRIVELLGCFDTGAAGGLTAERWCCLSQTGPATVPVRLAGKTGGKLWCGVVEDLSSAVNLRGVVRIRRDCPILTPLCITHRCPSVHAFVSVDGPHFAARTMSRETFLARLASGRVRPLM